MKSRNVLRELIDAGKPTIGTHVFGIWPGIVEVIGDALVRWARDPVGVAAEHGRMTGACCFCRRTLTTDESLAVGYGPVCATRYHLPWGNTPAPAPMPAPSSADVEADVEEPGDGRVTLVAAHIMGTDDLVTGG